MDIISYVMDKILDPTNIIEGERYEFTLELNIDEEDELFQKGGVDLRAIISKKDEQFEIKDYFFIAKADQTYLEFALEDDEEAEVLAFCKNHIEAGE
ncbi:MAG: pullulanase [Kurthia sp.]|nr:pullulanase [Candidatus Kurthia equi]